MCLLCISQVCGNIICLYALHICSKTFCLYTLIIGSNIYVYIRELHVNNSRPRWPRGWRRDSAASSLLRTVRFVCMVSLPVSYIKVMTDAQQYLYCRLMSPTTIKKHVGLYVICPNLHWNQRIFFCSRPSLDAQFG
jgi:hypothetical protein